MNLKRLFISASAVALLLPFSAQAERMNFAYVQATGLVNTDLDGGTVDVDGDGFGVRASWIYGPYAFMDMRYDDVDLDNNTDSRSGNFRLGARTSIDIQSPMRLDIYGMLSLEAAEISRGSVEFLDDTGFGITGGARFGLIRELESNLELNYIDYGKDSAYFVTVEGIWNVANWFGLIMEFRNGKYDLKSGTDLDRTDFNLGIRWQFGGDETRGMRGY